MVLNLWKYRGLIVRNALDDLRNRYRGSIAGYLWNVFLPLAQIVVFAVIFGTLMGWRGEFQGYTGRWGFVVYLCAGLLPWTAFADTLMRGVSSLVGNAGYLKKLPVPEQLFVAQDACSGFISGMIAMLLFLVFAVAVAGIEPSWAWLQVVPALALFIMFAFGLGLLLSCLNVFFRDVQPFMNVVVLLWFWLTPIVYGVKFINDRDPRIAAWLPLNPAFHFVEAFHVAVAGNVVSWSTWYSCVVVTLLVNVTAYAVLRKLRPDIRDVL
jgi:ABC-type polysaccharide/polyol phosphate export permease